MIDQERLLISILPQCAKAPKWRKIGTEQRGSAEEQEG